MAKKRKKPSAKGQQELSRVPLYLAYAFGALCAAAGVFVIAFGSGGEVAGTRIRQSDIVVIGLVLIVLGIAAIALSMFIARGKR